MKNWHQVCVIFMLTADEGEGGESDDETSLLGGNERCSRQKVRSHFRGGQGGRGLCTLQHWALLFSTRIPLGNN